MHQIWTYVISVPNILYLHVFKFLLMRFFSEFTVKDNAR